MGNKKYVAYVGTYTYGTSKGIQVYDVDVENGKLIERSEVNVSNASHTAVSKNGKYLYSIEDEGVAVFKRDENGDLVRINSVGIDGMRGCFLATDVDGRYLYVAGYHDGKVTVVHTHKDGSLGRIMDGVFHKGLGSVAERNFRPHVNCVRPTPDNKYLCAVDNGIDQVKIYRINKRRHKLELVDILRCPRESGLCILRRHVDVTHSHDTSLFQINSTLRSNDRDRCASCNISGHTYRNVHSKFDSICRRYLNLCCTADWSEYTNFLDRTELQTNDRNSFI